MNKYEKAIDEIKSATTYFEKTDKKVCVCDEEIDIIRELVNKSIPKMVDYEEADGDYLGEVYCPTCNNPLPHDEDYGECLYCPNCSQRLKYPDPEDAYEGAY